MTFPREYPSGVPALQLITPTNFENWDIRISQAVDGTGGGTYSGAIILTDTRLQGTSEIDINGDIATTGNVTGDVGHFDSIDVADFVDVVTVYASEVNCRSVVCDRAVPRSVGSQTISTNTATVLALDFTLHDTWEITLQNGASSAACAILSTTATLVDTSGTPELEVKPGAKIRITFKAAAGQTGGIGLSSTVFPASFHGMSAADLVGPRTGAVTGLGGENDWMRLDLENIGTVGTPKYNVTITMGAG